MLDKLKSPERLAFFSDAVVAIALTLLVLPVTEIVSDARKEGPLPPVHELIVENQAVIWSFLLSFAVIVRLWIVHHRIFEQVKAYSMPLMMLNMCWLLTVVTLPFQTELVANYPARDRLVLVLYVGTLFVSSVLLAALLWIVRNNPEVQRAPGVVSDRWWWDAVSGTIAFLAALVLVAVFPALSYWPLVLQLLLPQVVRLFHRDR